jgi:hypothetical protein
MSPAALLLALYVMDVMDGWRMERASAEQGGLRWSWPMSLRASFMPVTSAVLSWNGSCDRRAKPAFDQMLGKCHLKVL